MQSFMKAVAWSLVHSLWLGLAAALLAAIIISATRKTTARLRYNLLGTVFLLFLLSVSVTFIIYFREPSPASLVVIPGTGETAGIITNDIVSTGGFTSGFVAWFDNNNGFVLLAWALFFLVNCLKLVTGLAAVNRLRHYRTYPVADEWKVKLEQLQDGLGIRQSVCLLQSELIKNPVALGFLKPVILLPVGLLTNIPPEQVEAILLHELGHIRRKDYLVNFLQHFVEAIFFFNPAIRWISSLLRQEREACCDDIVVAETGQKRNYLNALVSFQEYSLNHNLYAMGISSKRQYLLNRVKRILTNENKKLNLFEKSALLAGIVLFSAFTYITNKKETVGASFPIAAEQFTTAKAPTVFFTNNIPGDPQLTAKKTIYTPDDKPLADTVPVKKGKIVSVVQDTSHNKLPASNDWEAAKILTEIQLIKDQIGVKKESIGVKKEQLANAKDSKEEEALKDQIEKERDEVEKQRDVLEEKREQLNILRKLKERQNEIKNEQKNEIKNDDKNEKKDKIDKERNDVKRNTGSGTGTGKKELFKKDNTPVVKSGKTPLFKTVKKPLFRIKNTGHNTAPITFTKTILDVKKVEIKPNSDIKLEKLEYMPGQPGKLEYMPGKKGQLEYEPGPAVKLNPPQSPDIKKKPQSPPPAKQVKI